MPPPDRWGDYSMLGSVIEGTRILCCKVPLKHTLVRTLPEEERFTPEILVNKLWETKHTLGLIVDLTFTKKYYNSSEFTQRDVLYEKIYTKGHDVPSDKVFGRFAYILDSYVEQNESNTSVIAVHCTHGVNRTGYLVSRYLIERHNMTPEDAINAFNTARGHDLERENYIHDLRSREPGVKTVFDPSAPMSDEEKEGPRGGIKLPRSRQEAENSYSRLLDMHRRKYVGECTRQNERDKEFRNQRSTWNRRETEPSDWQERGGDDQDLEGCNNGQVFGTYQGGSRDSFDRNQGGSFHRGSGGPVGREWRGKFHRGHGNMSYKHDPQNQHGRRGWGPRDGRFQPYDGHNYDRNDNNEYVSTMRFRNDSAGSYTSRGGFRQNRGHMFNGSDGFDEQDNGEFQNPMGFRPQFKEHHRGEHHPPNYTGDYWEARDPDQFQSSTRYADWSVENDRYENSGWQSRGQGRGSRRPYNRRW